jgi:hypothetical protein
MGLLGEGRPLPAKFPQPRQGVLEAVDRAERIELIELIELIQLIHDEPQPSIAPHSVHGLENRQWQPNRE